MQAPNSQRQRTGFISMMTMRPIFGIDRKLHVRPTGIHADFTEAADRTIAHHLVFARCCQGLP